MGTYALSLEDGLMTTDPSEAYTKELVMTRAREVIVLADAGKLGPGRSSAPDVSTTWTSWSRTPASTPRPPGAETPPRRVITA